MLIDLCEQYFSKAEQLQKEIAEYKNLTIGSVQSTYYQALEKLRKEFGK